MAEIRHGTGGSRSLASVVALGIAMMAIPLLMRQLPIARAALFDAGFFIVVAGGLLLAIEIRNRN